MRIFIDMEVLMKVGDLVHMPSSTEPDIAGVIVNLTDFYRGCVGVAWIDGDGKVENEWVSSLERLE